MSKYIKLNNIRYFHRIFNCFSSLASLIEFNESIYVIATISINLKLLHLFLDEIKISNHLIIHLSQLNFYAFCSHGILTALAEAWLRWTLKRL